MNTKKMKTRKKIFTTLVLILVLVPFSIANGQTPKVYSNAYDGFVNIRQTPSGKSAILGVLKNGPEGAVELGREGQWVKVDYNGVIGYVSSNYVQNTPTEVFQDTSLTTNAPTSSVPDWLIGKWHYDKNEQLEFTPTKCLYIVGGKTVDEGSVEINDRGEITHINIDWDGDQFYVMDQKLYVEGGSNWPLKRILDDQTEMVLNGEDYFLDLDEDQLAKLLEEKNQQLKQDLTTDKYSWLHGEWKADLLGGEELRYVDIDKDSVIVMVCLPVYNEYTTEMDVIPMTIEDEYSCPFQLEYEYEEYIDEIVLCLGKTVYVDETNRKLFGLYDFDQRFDYTKVSDYTEKEQAVIRQKEEEEMRKAMRRQEIIQYVTWALIGLAAIALLFFLVKLVMKPIRKLTEAIKKAKETARMNAKKRNEAACGTADKVMGGGVKKKKWILIGAACGVLLLVGVGIWGFSGSGSSSHGKHGKSNYDNYNSNGAYEKAYDYNEEDACSNATTFSSQWNVMPYLRDHKFVASNGDYFTFTNSYITCIINGKSGEIGVTQYELLSWDSKTALINAHTPYGTPPLTIYVYAAEGYIVVDNVMYFAK